MHKRPELSVKIAEHAQSAGAKASPKAGHQSETLAGLSCECWSTRMCTCAGAAKPTPSHLPHTAQWQKLGQPRCMRRRVWA